MAVLLVTSLQPLAGKTALVAGLAQRLRWTGRTATPLRLHAADPHAEAPQADARLYSLLPFVREPVRASLDLRQAAEAVAAAGDARVLLVEGDSGLPRREMVEALGARALLVARYQEGLAVPELRVAAAELGHALLGVVATAVPPRRCQEAASALAAAGLRCLGLLPEDHILASFTVAQLQDTLATQLLVHGDLDQVVERVVIGPVSADPGRDYFSRFPRKAVITRSHKPDLQLAALDSGTVCLIVAGGRHPLEYVKARAEEEEVPLLLTTKSTLEAARALEEVYGWARFQGQLKVERASELVAAHLDHDTLVRSLAPT
ncbi:MAG: DRTGG domain-containing protein [Dehalococcoidia bacterium]